VLKEPKLTNENLITHAQERFSRSMNFRQENVHQRWMDSTDLYNSKFKTSRERKDSDVLLGQGRLFIPKTYSNLHRILVDLLDTYFFDKEEIVDITSWKNIPAEVRLIVKSLMNYRLNSHPVNFYQEAYDACISALRNKVGIFKVYPQLKKSRIKPEDVKALAERKGYAIDVNLEKMSQEKLREVYIRLKGGPDNGFDMYEPVIEARPYEDVFFDVNATWKDYYKYTVIDRFKRSMDYLKISKRTLLKH